MKRIFILIYWFLLKKQSFELYMFHRGIRKDIETRKIQHERMREVSQLFKIVTIKLEQDFINWR